MEFQRYTPRPPLSRHVEYLWSLRDRPAHAIESVIPTGTLELVVNLEADALRVYRDDSGVCTPLSGAVVSGAYGRAFATSASRRSA